MDFRHRHPTSETSKRPELVNDSSGQLTEGRRERLLSGRLFPVDSAEENRFPCSLFVGCLVAVAVVFAVAIYAAVYIPPIMLRGGSSSDGLQWWQTAVIYQIYPRSFKDSDADGTGDIAGIISKLDCLHELGIGAIWIGPVYPSPQIDFGYDVTDHCAVDTIYGTIEDMEQLINETHRRDMRVILDFIPNHVSDQHPWFQRSRRQQMKINDDDDDYSDFFIWSNGRQGGQHKNASTTPPNNWKSAFGGSAWSWDEQRKQFYFHQFSHHQPDLNFRNPAVIQKMTDVMKFWIEKGVDGFRVDAADFLIESKDLSLNEPLLRDSTDSREGGAEGSEGGGAEEKVGFHQLNHIYTQHQSETHQVFQLWRQFLANYEQQSGKHIVLIAETFDNSTTMNWWKSFYENGAVDMPFNFYLMERTNDLCNGICFRSVVEALIRHLPKDKWLNWVLGSHDQKRVSTKYGCRFVNVLNMLNLLLPGTAITYQGEEIGMEDIHVTYEETKDPLGINAGPSLYKTVSRDGSRSPMQWNDAENGGFTSGRNTWLPVHPNYVTNNIQVQQGDPSSTWWQYKHLVDLRRRSPAFIWGEVGLSPLPQTSEQVFAFVRFALGNMFPRYLVIANVGKMSSTNNFTGHNFGQIGIPKMGKVVHLSSAPKSCPNVKSLDFSSSQFPSDTKSSEYSIDDLIMLDNVTLDSGEGLVVEFHSGSL